MCAAFVAAQGKCPSQGDGGMGLMATQPGSVRKCLQQVCADFQSLLFLFWLILYILLGLQLRSGSLGYRVGQRYCRL